MTPTCMAACVQVQRRELFSKVRVASQIRQAPLRRSLGNVTDLVHPFCHILPSHRLEQVMTAILGVQLERE